MSQLPIDQAIQAALTHHQAGRLPQAEAIYKDILDRQPNLDVVLHLLGVLSAQDKRYETAVDLMRRATVLEPGRADYFSNLGNALMQLGRVDDAIASCRRAIALNPAYPEAHHNLATALDHQGQLEAAAESYRQAIALRPNSAPSHQNLAFVLYRLGQLDEALAGFARALALQPNHRETLGRLGAALIDKGRFEEAIECSRHALALWPDDASAHGNLGLALLRKDHVSEAVAALERAEALNPRYAEAVGNLGGALHQVGRFGDALAAYRRMVALRPDSAEAHANLAFELLLHGDYAEGWAEYEWRWRSDKFKSLRSPLPQPRWRGEPLTGRTILLTAEQGLGDALQFARYVPLVAERGAKVSVEVPREVHRLLQTSYPEFEWIVSGQPLPAFDAHCPFMSLPLALGSRAIPPYLRAMHADAATVETWKSRVAEHRGLKVGLAWAGNRSHDNDRNRSMALAHLAPLRDVPGVTYFSLQKGDRAAEVRSAELPVVDWTHAFEDFAETAGLIANLDLVISVDTSMAHLAGAMGKPVWTLLPFAPDWRWLIDRGDCPWYPSMRLFRQPAIADWGGVVRNVVAEMRRI